MAENRIKIMLVSLVNRNYGDSVIADNTAFLIRKALGSRAEILSYDLRCGDVYRIRFCDAVVFAGGGLIKFRGECFLEYISEIVNEAQEHDIPVYFNSVGVEGYDDNDPTCQALKEVINLPCVKSISVRDDTELLKSSYLTRKQSVHSVIDPAVWCRQTYTDIIPEKTGYVGIGIAREQLFCDYGHSELDGEYMLRFWRELIDKLEAAISYIAEKVSNLFKVKLMKMLWYADALSYKENGVAITGLVYRHNEMGALPIGH